MLLLRAGPRDARARPRTGSAVSSASGWPGRWRWWPRSWSSRHPGRRERTRADLDGVAGRDLDARPPRARGCRHSGGLCRPRAKTRGTRVVGVAPPTRRAPSAEVWELGAAGRAGARRCGARAEGHRPGRRRRLGDVSPQVPVHWRNPGNSRNAADGTQSPGSSIIGRSVFLCLHPHPPAPATAPRGSTRVAPSSPPRPWTAHSPGDASRSSATGRAGGRPPSRTRRPGRPVGFRCHGIGERAGVTP